MIVKYYSRDEYHNISNY